MGCCFTKPARDNHPQNTQTTPHHHHNHNLHHNTPTQEPSIADRAPPPTLEQEYVKEVLSETPIPNIHPAMEAKEEVEKVEVEKVVEEVSLTLPVDEVLEVSEVSQSQVSEMCSASESYSTATTMTDKREEEVVSKPGGAERVARSPVKAPRKRPHSGDISGGRERFAKSSPATRAQPSRSWQHNAGVRRDPGESSGRRSRSPVTRGAARGASVGTSPMKKKQVKQNVGVGVGAESVSQKQNKEEELPPQQQGNNNDSIDNPHVSMECFIFL